MALWIRPWPLGRLRDPLSSVMRLVSIASPRWCPGYELHFAGGRSGLAGVCLVYDDGVVTLGYLCVRQVFVCSFSASAGVFRMSWRRLCLSRLRMMKGNF